MFKLWRKKPKSQKCRKCKCMQRMTHQHFILDDDDPQFGVPVTASGSTPVHQGTITRIEGTTQ